ncbi:hypothetical protein F4802DRAFT_583830 [Xylaria palmicola]|nr:hypothetical protein F4802DRAFT_583830 [Xylaria palmicola]
MGFIRVAAFVGAYKPLTAPFIPLSTILDGLYSTEEIAIINPTMATERNHGPVRCHDDGILPEQGGGQHGIPQHDNVADFGHHPEHSPPFRLSPSRATFVAIAFIAKCKLGQREREQLDAHSSTSRLFLLFIIFISIGAVRLRSSMAYCPDSREQLRQIQVNIHANPGLVGVLLLLVFLRRCYPSTTINVTFVNGIGNDVRQRGS